MSKLSRDAIAVGLAKNFTDVRVSIVNNLADLQAVVARCPDLVFLGMEYVPGDTVIGLAGLPYGGDPVYDAGKIWISDVLDSHNIPYTGSSQAAHQLGRDKPLAKQRVLNCGLRTAAYCLIGQQQSFGEKDIPLHFPLFVKPTNRGGGQGIDSNSVVHTFEQLRAKVQAITSELQSDVLVEEYLSGREFSVAILQDEYSDKYIAMPIELVAPADKSGSRLLSGEVKSSNVEQVLVVTDPVMAARVNRLALAVFDALGARDYGRIDIRLDAVGTPYFLEANLIPSLIQGYGSFPKACVINAGLDYEPMILRLAELGLARSQADIADIVEPITIARPVLLPA